MALVEIMQLVDARGLSCPMPIVRTASSIDELGSGEFMELVATDPASVGDVAIWCRTSGNELVQQSGDGATYRFVIRRK